LGANKVNAQEFVLSDSAIKKFSVEELVKIRKLLAKQRENLYELQEKTREKGVDISEDFLENTSAENTNQDKILIRVAEYYIEEENLDFERRYSEYDKAYDEYDKQFKLYEQGNLKIEPQPPVQPKRDYDKAIYLYDLIISDFPESDLIDDALYSKAFLLEEMGEDSLSQQIFQEIIDQHPESNYAAESYLKIADGFFYPKPDDSRETSILKLKKAIQLYGNVLQFKESPRYDEALYKIGWSYYRLAGEDPKYYTDAIVHFMAVIQDIERNKANDPTGKYIIKDVQPEAIEYIAASFTDTSYHNSGVASARTFVEKIVYPDVGVKIMEKMGDRYAKITLWDNSIKAYHELLSIYPDYIYAPRIQKKIADAYLADSRFEQAFDERKILFDSYSPKSEWYANLEQLETDERLTALDEAYTISEEALRTNVYYLFKLAESKEEEGNPDIETYRRFVEASQNYLNNYPTDENAYEINWAAALILDTKLARFEEAFEEYLRVSNYYLEEHNRQDAAINAIAVADTLVKMRMATRDTTVVEGVSVQGVPPGGLSKEEKMLAEAYDNYIKLFPGDPQTPSILADAGALYYNHRQFDLAKKYYKTMVTKFPEAQQKNIGLISLMNSYFFLGQYSDAEVVARKILETPDIPQEQVELAKQKVGQSIYKNAEKYEQEEMYVEAAGEYLRVYNEASQYIDFSDLALFKSANNYEKAGEWLKSIATYEILISNMPESKHTLPALGNIAEDYKEIEDYTNVGKTYERIFNMYPDTEDAEAALFNASLFYAKGENWREAIRANERYITAYPANPESKELLFENANHYLKLGELASANTIYQNFSATYPNDPRTVEAFYNRGDYYYKRSEFIAAKQEYNKAIRKSEEFAKTGQDPNLYYAAESYNKLGVIVYNEYNAIELSYPKSRLRSQLQQKSNKLEEVRNAYTKVIELGSIRGFESIYRIAEAYEGFADAIANQELPPNLNAQQDLVERDRVFKASIPAYDQAVEEYKNAIINIPKLADKLEVSLTDTVLEAPETMAEFEEDTAVIKKEIEVDSSSIVAQKWFKKAKDKVSFIQFRVADNSSDFISSYLRAPNPETGIKSIAYDGLVLKNLVQPAVQTTIAAHLKNINVSQELNLENKYVSESKRKILLTENIVADEYTELFYKSHNMYLSSIPTLEDLIERGASATSPEGLDYYDYQDTYVMQLIYYMNNYSKNAINSYLQTLRFAHENNIENDATLTTEEKLFNFAYEAGDLMGQLSVTANEKIEYYLEKFDSTENPNYQLATSFFDDQTAELTAYSKEIFEEAINFSEELEVENIWTQLILAKLVELDPATYLADLPKVEFVLESDSVWLASTVYEPGWNYLNYNDSDWENAVVVDLPVTMYFPLFEENQISPPSIWVESTFGQRETPSLDKPSLGLIDKGLDEEVVEDTLFEEVANDSVVGDSNTEEEPDTLTANFRYKFSLDSDPIEGWVAITGDKTFRLFMNDAYILGVDDSDFESGAQIIPFEAFRGILKKGENVIACSVTDTDGAPRYGLRLYLMLKFIPGEITEIASKIRNSQQENVDPEKFKQAVILNKNNVVE
jgi:tetratricopeptide (TPR) repeat protein